MFTAILSTIITSFSDVFWKKSLNYNLGASIHSLCSYPMWILLVLYFASTGFDFLSIHILAIGIVAIILLIDIIREPIIQQVYKEEKISVIMPYLNLNRIFVIIASFFLYQDVSYISFGIIICTIILIALSSIDIKSRRLPRSFWKILFTESWNPIWILLWGWLILNYSEIIYFNLYIILGTLLIWYITLKKKQFKDLRWAPIDYWKYRFISSLGWISWFLSLVVIKNLWLSISILLGFLGIASTLFISYVFLKDTPSKKDIILTFTVAILIWIWYYFK